MSLRRDLKVRESLWSGDLTKVQPKSPAVLRRAGGADRRLEKSGVYEGVGGEDQINMEDVGIDTEVNQ